MLVFTRRVGEQIEVTVLGVKGSQVRRYGCAGRYFDCAEGAAGAA